MRTLPPLLVVMGDGHGVRRTPSGTVQEFWRPLTQRTETELEDATLVDVGWVPDGVGWTLLRQPDGTSLINRYDKYDNSSLHPLTISGTTESVQLVALDTDREGRLFVVTDRGCIAEADGWYDALSNLRAVTLPTGIEIRYLVDVFNSRGTYSSRRFAEMQFPEWRDGVCLC